MGKGGHLEASGQGGGYHTAKWQPRGGQNQTAAPHPPRWSSWDRGAVEEFEGNGKWGALGEIRRAAVECQPGCANDRGIKGRALAIAQRTNEYGDNNDVSDDDQTTTMTSQAPTQTTCHGERGRGRWRKRTDSNPREREQQQ